jgi:hypothetical protein|tara:strand:+ start:8833 stop:9003 length:171 start_codon:yes stop_codon:yes gene_type:complete
MVGYGADDYEMMLRMDSIGCSFKRVKEAAGFHKEHKQKTISKINEKIYKESLKQYL